MKPDNRLAVVSVSVVAVVALVCVTVLAALDKDVTQIGLLLVLLGMGGAIGQLFGIRNQVNGNVEKLTSVLERTVDHVAKSAPVDPDGKVDRGF